MNGNKGQLDLIKTAFKSMKNAVGDVRVHRVIKSFEYRMDMTEQIGISTADKRQIYKTLVALGPCTFDMRDVKNVSINVGSDCAVRLYVDRGEYGTILIVWNLL